MLNYGRGIKIALPESFKVVLGLTTVSVSNAHLNIVKRNGVPEI